MYELQNQSMVLWCSVLHSFFLHLFYILNTALMLHNYHRDSAGACDFWVKTHTHTCKKICLFWDVSILSWAIRSCLAWLQNASEWNLSIPLFVQLVKLSFKSLALISIQVVLLLRQLHSSAETEGLLSVRTHFQLTSLLPLINEKMIRD